LFELKLGGVVYVIGVIFFKCDGRIPLAHAIWHLFVVAGSMIHYFAVINYLFEDDREHGRGEAVLAKFEATKPAFVHTEF
jgi:hypothetical protein